MIEKKHSSDNGINFIKKFILIFAFLFGSPFLFSQESTGDNEVSKILLNPNRINILENIIINKQDKDSVFSLYSQDPLDYEIISNLDKQVLTIKLRNISFSDSIEKYETDDLIKNVKIVPVAENEYWILLKLVIKNLNYNIITDELLEGKLDFIFTTDRNVNSISKQKKINRITNWRIGERGLQEIITINFTNKPQIQSRLIEFPKELYRIKFTNTSKPDLTDAQLKSNLFEKIEFLQRKSNLFFDIKPKNKAIRVIYKELENPYRIIFNIIALEQSEQIFVTEEKTAEDTQQDNEILNSRFIKAEQIYRTGNWNLAKLAFNNLYAVAPLTRIGIRALFRAADAEYEKAKQVNNPESYLSTIEKYQAAISYAEEAGVLGNDIIKAKYNIARAYLEAGYNDLAKVTFEDIIAINPDHPLAIDAAFGLGSAYVVSERSKQAIDHLKQTIEDNPNSRLVAQGYFDIGIAHYNMEQFKKAADSFDLARSINIYINRDKPEDLIKVAESYYESVQSEKANTVNQDLITRFPYLPLASYIAIRIGDYYVNQTKPDEAIKFYEFAINKQPIDMALLARLRIANILAESQKEENKNIAINFYDFIINEFPKSEIVEEALLRKGLAYSFYQEYEKSIDVLKDFTTRYPKTQFSLVNVQQRIIDNVLELIKSSYSDEKYHHVIHLYLQYKNELESTPAKFPYLLVGSAFKKIGDYKNSNAIYENSIQLSVLNISNISSFALAVNYYDQGDVATSLKRFHNYIKKYPNDHNLIFAKMYLAKIYNEMNDTLNAIKQYHDVIRDSKNTNNPIEFNTITRAYFNLAEVYQNEGAFEDALKHYKNTIDNYKYPLNSPNILPEVINSFFRLGDMNMELEFFDEALKDYGKAISIFKDSPNVLQTKYKMGLIYQDTGKEEKALEIYRKIVNSPRNANDIVIWYQLAQEGINEIETKKIATK